jgi:uncharacterized BrkB/YihY/UPF0761 family membrane protein
VRQHAGILGLIGILGMLWSGSSLFGSMEFALGRMFGVGQRDFLRQRLMALMMTGIFVAAIVPSVAVAAVMGLLHGLFFGLGGRREYGQPAVGTTASAYHIAVAGPGALLVAKVH